MTPLTELKKGCGKVTNWYELKRLCGTFEDLKHSEHIILCPTCQALLTQAEDFEKMIDKFIEDYKRDGSKLYNDIGKHWLYTEDLKQLKKEITGEEK